MKFSVIIPNYNGESSLRAAIESVLSQTYREFELIVIDDGSTDQSRLIIKSYDDERLKSFFIDNSGGPAYPRNVGIKNSVGDYLLFLDSDDIWLKDKLSVIREYINNNPDVNFICHDYYYSSAIDNQKSISRIVRVDSDLSNWSYIKMLCNSNPIATSSVILSKKLITEGFRFDSNQKLSSVEDFDLWLRIRRSGYLINILNRPLTIYNFNPLGISKNIYKHNKNLYYLYLKHLNQLGNISFFKKSILFFRIISQLFWSISYSFLLRRSYVLFAITFFFAFLLNPINKTSLIIRRKLGE